MTQLSIQEVLKFAVQLERRGLIFFREWADKSELDEVKMFFSMLGDEEEDHVEVFLKLSEQVDAGDPQFQGNEKFHKFFESFSRDVMYNNKAFSEAKTLNQALELAKKQERDVQLFYSELKKYVDESYHKVIDKIVSEEQDHYRKIDDLQKKLNFPLLDPPQPAVL